MGTNFHIKLKKLKNPYYIAFLLQNWYYNLYKGYIKNGKVMNKYIISLIMVLITTIQSSQQLFKGLGTYARVGSRSLPHSESLAAQMARRSQKVAPKKIVTAPSVKHVTSQIAPKDILTTSTKSSKNKSTLHMWEGFTEHLSRAKQSIQNLFFNTQNFYNRLKDTPHYINPTVIAQYRSNGAIKAQKIIDKIMKNLRLDKMKKEYLLRREYIINNNYPVFSPIHFKELIRPSEIAYYEYANSIEKGIKILQEEMTQHQANNFFLKDRVENQIIQQALQDKVSQLTKTRTELYSEQSKQVQKTIHRLNEEIIKYENLFIEQLSQLREPLHYHPSWHPTGGKLEEFYEIRDRLMYEKNEYAAKGNPIDLQPLEMLPLPSH